MLVTLDTSQFEMSLLKAKASKNKAFMSVTLDTSHSVITPRLVLAQCSLTDTLRHTSTALLSSDLDLGENAGVE